MIGPAQPEDVPAIEQVAIGTGKFTAEEIRTIRELLEAYLHPEPRDDHTFIVYRNGTANTIAGFACYGPTPLTDRVWDLYWICVERAQQRNGIGSRLLSAVERQVCARGARAMYLETSDSDEYRATREFYERHNYERVASLDDFYSPGEGKVIYRKVFQSRGP